MEKSEECDEIELKCDEDWTTLPTPQILQPMVQELVKIDGAFDCADDLRGEHSDSDDDISKSGWDWHWHHFELINCMVMI